MLKITTNVCVIGAGPAGLAMCRALKERGISFDIFERNSGIGGIWNPAQPGSPVYEAAHFISSKGAPTSTFRGHAFADHVATYPSHSDVLAYLQTFADQTGVSVRIQLGNGVKSAQRDGGHWIVATDDGQSRAYGALVCASGTLWDPNIPELPGSFSGRVRHSVTYRSPSEVAGKRVLVIGAGNSGVDIACDATKTAKRVLLSVRRGYWFVPKFIRGIPTDVFFRSADSMPAWAHPPDAAQLLELLVGKPSSYGFPEPDHDPFTSHPIMNSEVLHHVGHGRIEPRRSVVDAIGHEIEFSDGVRDEVDEVILATGYRASVPYLPEGTFDFKGNRPDLFLRLFHRRLPNLYGLGFIETNSSVFRLFDIGAELIARRIEAGLNGASAARSLDNEIAERLEPDLSGGIERVSSARHDGYVDSRAYERALAETIRRHFGGS